MNCEHAEPLLGQLVFGDLDEKTRKDLAGHIEKCPKCRALAGDMRVAAKLLGEGIEATPAPKLSPERREELVRLGEPRPLVTGPKPVGRAARVWDFSTKRMFRFRWIGIAAAVLLVCALLTGMLLPALAPARERARRTKAASLARQEQMRREIESMEATSEAKATSVLRGSGTSLARAGPRDRERIADYDVSGAPSALDYADKRPSSGEADDDESRVRLWVRPMWHHGTVTVGSLTGGKSPGKPKATTTAPRRSPATRPEPGYTIQGKIEKAAREKAGDGLDRSVALLPPAAPASERRPRPGVPHEEYEIDKRMDRGAARGGEDDISDVPLGGPDVTAALGLGAGTAGAIGYRRGGGRRPAEDRGEDKLKLPRTSQRTVVTRGPVRSDGKKEAARPDGLPAPPEGYVWIPVDATEGASVSRGYGLMRKRGTAEAEAPVSSFGVTKFEHSDGSIKFESGVALSGPSGRKQAAAKRQPSTIVLSDRVPETPPPEPADKPKAEYDQVSYSGTAVTRRPDLDKPGEGRPSGADATARMDARKLVDEAKLRIDELARRHPPARTAAASTETLTREQKRERDRKAKDTYTNLRKTLPKLKTQTAKIASLEAKLGEIRGSRYEKAVQNMIRRERDAMVRGSYSKLTTAARKRKTPDEKLALLGSALDEFKGTSYEHQIKKLIERESARLPKSRAASGKRGRGPAGEPFADTSRAWAEHSLEELTREKQVKIQPKLIEIKKNLSSADRLVETAEKLRKAGDVNGAERLAAQAAEKYARAGEIRKWMPYGPDRGRDLKKTDEGLRRARKMVMAVEVAKRREGEAAQRRAIEEWKRETGGGDPIQEAALPYPSTLSPRQLAAQKMLGVEVREGAEEPSKPELKAEPAPQQFVTLSQEEAQAIETRAARAEIARAQAAEEPQEPEPPPEPELELKEDIARPETARERAPAPLPPVNPFVMTAKDRFSTFAMDVDTASYSMARNYILRGYLPPARLIRMEEFVNAFDYNYPRRTRDVFNIHAEGMPSPFGKDLALLKVGIRARVLGRAGRKPAHLVFVVDTSGSMDRPDRIPLVKLALALLTNELSTQDRVSLVTYGTGARLILEAVSASHQDEIRTAVEAMQCGGSTNLLDGIRVAYQQAERGFRPGEINRVILCSDGVANVGPSDAEEILANVKAYRDWGITLTCAGFGAGSYDDVMMERLANSGDGNYVFIDSAGEARRVFVEEMSATLQTVAKDAKIQVEFDPRRVRRYRLVGYENRDIADEDFRNDAVDAGEVGSGQSVTALYEIELLEPEEGQRRKDLGDVGTVYVRYRNVETDKVEEIASRLGREIVRRRGTAQAPRLFLAACVAEFAEILRGSEHAKGGDLAEVRRILEEVAARLPLDKKVQELVRLVRRARGLPRAN